MTGTRPPRVSVCVCTYNDAGRVGRAIDSVLAQTHEDLEVVVVDDRLDRRDLRGRRELRRPRIRISPQSAEPRVTLAIARLRRQLAAGEFIKYVDQDDWIARDCIAEHLRLFDHRPALGLTFSRRELCFETRVAAAAAVAPSIWEPHRAFGSLTKSTMDLRCWTTT